MSICLSPGATSTTEHIQLHHVLIPTYYATWRSLSTPASECIKLQDSRDHTSIIFLELDQSIC